MPRRCSLARSRQYSWKERTDLRDEWKQSINARTFQNAPLDKQHAVPRKISDLPALSSKIYAKQAVYGWRRETREVMIGTRDVISPLRFLRGFEDTIIKDIFSYIEDEFADHVTLTIPACYVSCVNTKGGKIGRYSRGRCIPYCHDRDIVEELPVTSRVSLTGSDEVQSKNDGFVSFAVCGSVDFPEPNNINVNMLPFVIGRKSSLPMYLQHYFDCIERCPYSEEEDGKIGYLTIHESFVEAGTTQQKEGLRIEDPKLFSKRPSAAAFSPALEHVDRCDLFLGPDMYEGGTYMASNIDDASEVWDALVDKSVPGIVERNGDCEQLRKLIGPGTKVKANQLIWMTDCSPYKEIPQEKSCYRQSFRVVTSSISHWYADHSTPNPLVCLPDDVAVVYGKNHLDHKS